ncbi:PAS domain-containing sensor histidine kinase [Candidatus Bealeia paramacronuclearis]|uniref:histidine kinase n=1 Tax=Candidatus Bealeia paramacronuclearis TaxID=1921001 RepID=A0ABZ2C125_9PROT|nr:PAS domain-containing sensor histidine kinase [Candidatus Bealeia paramacronuclearis]
MKNQIRTISAWSEKHRISEKLAVALAIATGVSVIATYIALTDAPPLIRGRKFLIFLLYLDLVLLLLLGGVVARRFVALWVKRKSGEAGAQLHSRMVGIFSLLAITPTILMAAFSALFFNIGVQSWFSQRVETAVGESMAVAEGYLREHEKVISANAQASASSLSRELPVLLLSPTRMAERLTEEVRNRSLDEGVIFDKEMNVLARSQFSYSLAFESIQSNDIKQVLSGHVVTYTADESHRVRALAPIDVQRGIFLLVGRKVDAQILDRVENATKAAHEYEKLEGDSTYLAIKFALIFVGIAVLLLLVAIWGGLVFANRLVKPISRLINAAEKVSSGDLSVRVITNQSDDELARLTKAFNHMTEQLASQRKELVEAHEQVDKRRRFTETVLAGVSAGVIGLDQQGHIYLPNKSASLLLGKDLKRRVGQKLSDVIPPIGDLLDETTTRTDNFLEQELTLPKEGEYRTFLFRVAVDRTGDRIRGYVITFDDITEIQAAQKNAAWADVARRIAHEIKNPLLPIQLAAERLKRRYLKQINNDPETFQACTDTIVRQVGHIGHMVSEFSAFARMPAPQMKEKNLIELIEQAVFLQKQAHPRIAYTFSAPEKNIIIRCDDNQMGQALTNLLQNAADAITPKLNADEHFQGEIQLTLDVEPNRLTLKINDNGTGLPKEGREKLLEPYVTFREEGTGLGLAIVKKIMEDHGGRIVLQDSKLGGAEVVLTLGRVVVSSKRLAS